MGIPTYALTPQYLSYLHTLPPLEAIDKLEEAAAWLNAKTKKRWQHDKRRHNMYSQYRDWDEYTQKDWMYIPQSATRLASIDHRKYSFSYNTRNHPPKYYY